MSAGAAWFTTHLLRRRQEGPEERLIRVLETRGRRGFLYLRSAEAHGVPRGAHRRPAPREEHR